MSRFKAVALIAGIGLALWTVPVMAQHEGGHAHKGGEHAEKMEMQKGAHAMTGKAEVRKGVHLTGEVVDIVCYTRMDSKGPDHIPCAKYCAEEGSPVGLLDATTGQVYVIFPPGHGSPAEKVMPYIGKQVEVTGTVHTRGGLKALTIGEISEVKE